MRWRRAALLLTIALSVGAFVAPVARAAEAEAEWGLEQPRLPGVGWAVALGHVGDVEFLDPNRGLLITAGNGSAVEPGVWTYDGQGWHELSNKCGSATGGRIAWAGPDEFWTVSDGRPGQAGESVGTQSEKAAPLANNTLCHFQNGAIVTSYAHPAFKADSYLEMNGAACLGPGDCWFGGNTLPEPQLGSFHLYWNGSTLEEEPYLSERFPVADMRASGGRVYESVTAEPRLPIEPEMARTPPLHVINPPGVTPLMEPEEEVGGAIYEEGEPTEALEAQHLSAADGALWAAAGPTRPPGQLTVAIREEGAWRLLIGPAAKGGAQLSHVLPEAEAAEEATLFEGGSVSHARVTAIAAEPGTGSAWIGVAVQHSERAVLLHVDAHGNLLAERTFPSVAERAAGVGEKGGAASLACPAQNDCWMATTRGWLYHLAPPGERTLPANGDANFEHLISYRPPDQGLPQVGPDAPPEDTSGLRERGVAAVASIIERSAPREENLVTLPLLSRIHTRLRGDVLQMSFHLSVKARVRLLAKRRKTVIASTPTHTFNAGNRTLLVRLDPHRWPTNIALQTHALQPLKKASSVTGEGANIGTETTGAFVSPFAQGGHPGLLP